MVSVGAAECEGWSRTHIGVVFPDVDLVAVGAPKLEFLLIALGVGGHRMLRGRKGDKME